MSDVAVSAGAPLRLLADQAFSRAAGAPLVPGNAVRLLKDAGENFPAWLTAIESAERSILFESYIFADDAVGRSFRDALAAKARAGVAVFVLHDWLGSPGKILGGFWKPLAAAGAAVRTFNPPRFDAPLGWMSRDHRKSIAVDGRIAFVTGLCVSAAWYGDPARGRPPWRDTGVEIRGPAVADVERAFAQVWSEMGPQLPDGVLTGAGTIAPAGDVALRVIASEPNTASLMRLDQLIAAIARSRLWLTDAYFVPVGGYVEALCAAARDGVDVRLLVPGASDIPVVSALSRAGYRPLLTAGVRVFEWNGTMLHAKTAVADGRWARVGSTNLNLASLVGNHELDVAIEDASFAATMERQYDEDLAGATEVVLHRRRFSRRPSPTPVEEPPRRRVAAGSAGRAAAGALRIGSAVGVAITRPRELEDADQKVMVWVAAVFVAFAAIALRWPHVVAWPAALIAAWLATAFVIRAWRGRRDAHRTREKPSS